jgi:DNA-binding response OmpR family regulator
MPKHRVLIVEDEPDIAGLIKHTLERSADADAEIVGTGDAALNAVVARPPDLIILDLNLPVLSGVEVCRILRGRSEGRHVPIIMLTARTTEQDRVTGLELGADDYVTKPFSPRELTARVQAAIRRQRKPAAQTTYRFGDCDVDFKKMTILRNGRPVVLTAHEFKLLKFFTDNAERVLTRDVLLNEVWGYNFYPTTRTVDNQILKLRQKLEPDPTNPKHLVTIYGAGYKFVP